MKQRPFKTLKDLPVKSAEAVSRVKDKHDPPALQLPSGLPDEELFDWAMRDVAPLEGRSSGRRGSPPRRKSSLPAANGDQEALHELRALVDGKAPFNFTFSDDYIENAIAPGARPLLRKLRRGQFSVQAVLDLHRMNRDEARQSVEAFILRSVGARRGCVKIIHGRGLNSKENRAVLKGMLQLWLATRRMSRYVLAYTSARPCDGGTGAVYVLLRKPRPPRKAHE